MRALAVLIIAGIFYGYAAVKTKSLLEGANRLQVCVFEFTRRGCDVASLLGGVE
jgi:hypothetical protein